MFPSKPFLLILGLAAALPAAQKLDYPIQAVPFTQVKLTDSFWLPRLKTNTDVTILASFARCENTNRVKNFEMAAAHQGKSWKRSQPPCQWCWSMPMVRR